MNPKLDPEEVRHLQEQLKQEFDRKRQAREQAIFLLQLIAFALVVGVLAYAFFQVGAP